MKSSYLLGLFFIVSVSIIWSAASILVQYLYQDLEFDSPFLLTYIGTSLFIILIPGFLLYDNRRYIFYKYCACFYKRRISTINDAATAASSSNPEQQQPQRRIFSEGTPLAMNRSVSSEQGEQLYIDDAAAGDEQYQPSNSHLLTHREHIGMAMKIAPWWFISNYFYNLSLKFTTITSSTVLSSTSSVFTFLLALIWGDEVFNRWKLAGVIMSFSGSFLTALHDAKPSQGGDGNDDGGDEPLSLQLWGDAAGLISAVGYGVYTVLLRMLCQDESRISMNLFLGYVGLLNMIALSPFALWCIDFSPDNAHGNNYYQENNVFDDGGTRRYLSGQHLTWFVLFCVVVKGLFDNVLSDYLWARSILLTSATVATVGLGLTIPLALLSDLFVMGRNDVWSFEGLLGGMLVLFGFVFVNIGESGKNDERESENINFDDSIDQVSLT